MTITVETDLEPVTCCKCGMLFAFPGLIERRLRENHETFYCPSGHPMSFRGQTDLEKAREELTKEKQRRDQAEAAAQSAANARAEAEHKLARLKKRAAAGKCPCCARNFIALHKHIANKHPEFVEKAKA